MVHDEVGEGVSEDASGAVAVPGAPCDDEKEVANDDDDGGAFGGKAFADQARAEWLRNRPTAAPKVSRAASMAIQRDRDCCCDDGDDPEADH